MSAAYLVIYEGKPEDTDEFLRYYTDHHVPIIWTWPRIRRVEIDLAVASGEDGGGDDGIFMVARFCFDSLADLRRALRSKGRERARVDRANLPPFAGRVRHQAVQLREVER